jgi:hypothetical protein
MNAQSATHNSYLLVDAAMAGFDERPDLCRAGKTVPWLQPLYEAAAAWTGPVLIDIVAAVEAGELDQAMAIVNATTPQLYLSIIDTALECDALAAHLRRFISIRNHEQQQFSLRFADCVVLAALPVVLSAEQWATVSAPLARWSVHRRDGSLSALPGADTAAAAAPIPLRLTAEQSAQLRDIFAPDRMIHCLRGAVHGDIPGTYAEQYRWASAAYAMWRASGNHQEIVWRWLSEAAFESRGAVLTDSELAAILDSEDMEAVRAGLRMMATRSSALRRS